MVAGGDRLRVLIVGPGPGSTGGMNTMIATSMASDLGDRYEMRRISLHRDGRKTLKLQVAVVGFSSLGRELLKRWPDLVWVHATKGASIQRKSLAVLMARSAGVPVIFHLHNDLAVDYLERAPAPVRRLARVALESCSAVVVLDPSWIGRLSRIASADYRHVPNPVDVPTSVDRSRTEPGRILQVGKLLRRKGVFTSLEALAMIRGEVPSANLHFVGDGQDEEELRRRAIDEEVAEWVTFHGWLPHEDVLPLLTSSQVVILPSEAEGLPMSLLEAMARAVPVVATPVGGIRALLEEGASGVLSPIGDSRMLAENLVRLLSDPRLAADTGQRGRQRVMTAYSAHRFADAMSALIEEVLATRC